jgi:hypothetical protein
MGLEAQIQQDGVNESTIHEISRLLRSLDQRRIPGLSIFQELYVMWVVKRKGLYKSSLDPYLEAELLGPNVSDIVSGAMSVILKESYGLKVDASTRYKRGIFLGDAKVGDLAYDTKNGHHLPRLRATLAGRTIVFCYRPVGLVVETDIHFSPPRMREQIRAEVLPILSKQEEEFLVMLKAKPSDFFGHVERAVE